MKQGKLLGDDPSQEIIRENLCKRKTPGFYKNYSVRQLILTLNYIQSIYRTSTGNWSIELYFAKQKENSYKYPRLIDLEYFYIQYSKRKKRILIFEKFLKNIEESKLRELNRSLSDSPNKLEFNNKANIHTFLEDLKVLKERYLVGSNETVIKIVHQNIQTGYSEKTLLKYYYDG